MFVNNIPTKFLIHKSLTVGKIVRVSNRAGEIISKDLIRKIYWLRKMGIGYSEKVISLAHVAFLYGGRFKADLTSLANALWDSKHF